MRAALRRVRFWQWAQIHYKVAFGAWIVVLIAFTPAVSSDVLGVTIYLVGTTVLAGVAVAVTGLILSAQPGKLGRRGLLTELSGICMMMVAPVVYLVVQVSIIASTPSAFGQRVAFIVLLYCTAAGLFARATRVGRSLRLASRATLIAAE